MKDVTLFEKEELQQTEGPVIKDSPLCYLRKNWCNVVRILLAIIGVAVPLVMYSIPCKYREVIIYERGKPPLDLFLLLDGSGSMQNDWPICLMAAANITTVIAESYPGNLRIGAGVFGSTASAIVNFTYDFEYAAETIYQTEWPNGGTDYVGGLLLFKNMWQDGRNPDPGSRTILVIISDGVPSSSTHYELASVLKGVNYNISIMGIMVSEVWKSQYVEELRSVSSCDGVESSTVSNCPWFAVYSDFEKFQRHAEEVANILTTEIVTIDIERTVKNCMKTPWLWFLLLLLPLLLVLMLPYCLTLNRKVRIRRAKPPPAVVYPDYQPNAQTAEIVGFPQESENGFFQGFTPSNQWFGGLHYNEVATEEPYVNYDLPVIGPNFVEEGGIRRRLSHNPGVVAVRDLGNGYVEEDYIDCRTLEEWTEDKVMNFWQNFGPCYQNRVICEEPVRDNIKISQFGG